MAKSVFRRLAGKAAILLALVAVAPVSAHTSGPGVAGPQPAASVNVDSWFGLYPAADFVVGVDGATAGPASRQAAWYFRNETIGVPRAGLPQAGFEAGVRTFDDVRHWAAGRAATAPIDYPPLVWVAASQRLRDARIVAGGATVITPAGSRPLQLVPKLPLNRSYADAASLAFFGSREVALRGEATPAGFVARSIWPQDFRLGPEAPPARAVPPVPPAEGLRILMREMPRGGAKSPYAAMTVWQRPGSGADWTGRPVLGLMVNGAQGDDDEAHGGHFAIVTGRVQPDGAIGDWLVSNFYSLDVESEKGIIAAPVPLDNYLADLNSGQGWYRPSVMVVAVLKDERAAVLVQSALNRVFNQFYRHQLVYYHPNQNCASICIDTLRALGWDVPARGPTSRVLAWLAYPLVTVKDFSTGKAKLAFDYLRTDQTRLMPAPALEQSFASLMAMARQGGQPGRDGALGRMLAEDLQALAFLRFPQFPSSRAFGSAAAVSTWEYRTLVPNDPALAQIVPVPPRPFPPELRDPDLLPSPWTPADYATLAWGLIAVVGAPVLPGLWWKRRRRRRSGARAQPPPG